MTYKQFIDGKTHSLDSQGFDPFWMPDFLYDFQKSLVEWAVRQGRCSIFADCGLGKTPMQLVWAENVCRKTDGRVLIICPLAVAAQTCREGQKFGIDVQHSKDGTAKPRITITNYERLHHFNPDDFSGVVCDESSAIKQFGGKRKKQVIAFMAKRQYRSLWTATAAPNDFIELGTHSEALGVMGQMDMLGTFFRSLDDMQHVMFKQGDFWNTHKWAFRAHAEIPFWRWVCSWARALRKPSDLGFDDARFKLPPLSVKQETVKNVRLLPGELFPVVAKSLKEQRAERHATITERCEKVADLVSKNGTAVIWCHMNEEGDLLEQIIPEAKQVYGSQDDDEKEEILNAFATGQVKRLVTKPKISGFGLNWQHCHHMTFFPSHSFEQYYQGVRRCWRFGQKKPVLVDIVTTEGEAGVTANLQRKADQAERMFSNLVAEMNNILHINRTNKFNQQTEKPLWL